MGIEPTNPSLARRSRNDKQVWTVELELAEVMKKKGRSPRSIQTSTRLKDWLDHPFSELTGAKLIELQQIKDQAANGTNPANDKGAPGISFRRRRWRTRHAR